MNDRMAEQVIIGRVRLGVALQGWVRPGLESMTKLPESSWHGTARHAHGEAGFGLGFMTNRFSIMAWHGPAALGWARLGLARLGWARGL